MLSRSKILLGKTQNIQRDSYVWNMMAGLLNAFQSVIFLMIITRTLDIYAAGVFTIAYATANLFLTIGKYGMRNYQVSDVSKSFSFQEYKYSRIITCTIMLIISIVYIIYLWIAKNYNISKVFAVFLMCILKEIDALEDVYHGFYQQQGRLDVGARLLTIRMVITILSVGIGLIIFNDLNLALLSSVLISAAFCFYSIKVTLPVFEYDKKGISGEKVKMLLRSCFPVFAGSFLSFYIGNAPKYAIDSLLNDELQACYGFIAMPVFVIGLLNNFIFQPILGRMSVDWAEKRKNKFLKLMFRQILIVILITVICLVGGFVLGVPVLSWLYNTDLASYRTELLIMLLGGGILALSGFLVVIITIIRAQKYIVYGYLGVAVLAYFLSPIFVEKSGILGASILYLVLMLILSIAFSFVLFFVMMKNEKLENNKGV